MKKRHGVSDSGLALEFSDDFHFILRRKIADGGMGSVYEASLTGSEGFEKVVTILGLQPIAKMERRAR